MSTIIDGSFTSVGTQFNLKLPSGYTEFKLVNITDVGSAAANTNVMRAYGTSLMAPGSAYLNLKTSGAATLALESMITTAGFTFWNPQSPPVFAQSTITGVTAASPAVVTTSAAHGLVVGDTVRLTGLNGTMQPMNGLIYTVDAVGSTTTFTITFDSSNAGIGGTPATAGFAQKVIVNGFSPQNVVIGPTATIASGNNLLLNMNTVPALSQGASQYIPFQTPYQPGAKLRLYIPNSISNITGSTAQSANFLEIQVITTQKVSGGYANASQLVCSILPGNPRSAITTAAGVNPIIYPTGAAGFSGQYPYVTDIAETVTIFSEAEDNTSFYGITVGTGVQTTGKLYQWFARQGYSI